MNQLQKKGDPTPLSGLVLFIDAGGSPLQVGLICITRYIILQRQNARSQAVSVY
ncbi:hypothetical protein [Coleofasciculus sp. B1-GNL1-01]|uniref:hypothetical protein n=1 Tax=Coleofasciculus sp. B1-GNL1-01 TaxID=3068484 RepID=UPI004062A7C8